MQIPTDANSRPSACSAGGRRSQNDQSRAAGRRRPWRLHLGRARPPARRAADRDRGRQRDQRRRHECGGAGLWPDQGRARRRAPGAGQFLAPRQPRRLAQPAAAVALDRAHRRSRAVAFAGPSDLRHDVESAVALSVQPAQLQSVARGARAVVDFERLRCRLRRSSCSSPPPMCGPARSRSSPTNEICVDR